MGLYLRDLCEIKAGNQAGCPTDGMIIKFVAVSLDYNNNSFNHVNSRDFKP